MSASTKLEVAGLTVELGGRSVLEDVKFSIAPGAFCAVVGPNGSGKTTLIRSLYRSIEPASGSISLDGKAIDSFERVALARRVAVLRQESEMAFDFSARELVAMGRSPHKGLMEQDGAEDHAVVDACMRACDLEGLADRSVRMMSGGERQRVLLARALAQQPGLLLLDEPTNHLDLSHKLDILARVREQSCTVVAALHEIELAHRFADFVVILVDGSVEAFGSPDEVLVPARISRVFGVAARRLVDGADAAWVFGPRR